MVRSNMQGRRRPLYLRRPFADPDDTICSERVF